MVIRVVFSIVLAFMLSACSGAETAVTNTTVAGDKVPLLSYQINSHHIVFEALGNGCSQADHFALQIDSIHQQAATVSVIRVKQDMCRRMPMWESFTLALPKALQGKTLSVTNAQGQANLKG
ncbi:MULTISPECIES: hypothetical protein [unclassified Vibrio]|uniref:hypothetical protein n=1 Tax=unclassified Vibrio TaxID=2614977 RepID=UPI001481E7A5|nr:MULTISPECIES: hypothetical protein [unclassified Vibrio]NNN43778.1 hypothetical protein [Vibrio sp. 1-1(7)]NNN71602.1 hypothetical protein [Vibrio sp. 12-2(3-a)]